MVRTRALHPCFKSPLTVMRGAALGCAVIASLVVSACATSLAPPAPNTTLANTNNTTANTQPPSTHQQRQQRRVKIAMLLPLGGISQTALIAKSMKQAGEMALFERDDPNIQLIVKDDLGTPEGAKAAAAAAIQEGAEIVLGPLFAGSVRGAVDAGRVSQPPVPVLTFSNDRSIAGNGAYLVSFLPEPEVDRIIDFASRNGKRRFVALIPDNAYGRIVEAAFQSAVRRNGGSIMALERYPIQSNGMIEPAQKVVDIVKQADEMGAPVDAIFLPGGANVLPSIGPLITYANIDTNRIKLLGTGAWDYPNIGRDQVFVGGWYPSPDPRGWRAFSERFARTFGQSPPRLATLAYDAMKVAIELADAPPTQRYTQARLTRPQGFNGVDGTLRFNLDGTASRSLAVLEVQKFGSKTIDMARTSFGGSTVPQSLETGSTFQNQQPAQRPAPQPAWSTPADGFTPNPSTPRSDGTRYQAAPQVFAPPPATPRWTNGQAPLQPIARTSLPAMMVAQ